MVFIEHLGKTFRQFMYVLKGQFFVYKRKKCFF